MSRTPDVGRVVDGARRDCGMSLVEVVVCVVLVGVAVVAVLGALGASIKASGQHRQHATADTLARSAAELISGPATSYVNCATPASYAPFLPTDPKGHIVVTLQTVEYWTGGSTAAFSSSCATDLGVARITVVASSTQGTIRETLQFVKRRLSGTPSAATPPATTTPPGSVSLSRAFVLLGAGSKVATISGGLTLLAQGDVLVSSTSNKWAKVSGSSTFTIGSAGTTQSGVSDPMSALATPSIGAMSVYTDGVYHGPGVYRTLPLTISANRAMASGTYITEAGMAITAGTVTGSAVFIFNGCATDSPVGCNNSGTFSIGASATVTLSPPTSGAYDKVLLFQHRSNTNDVTIAGGTTSEALTGRLYAPAAKIAITTGSAAMTVTGLIAKTATITGTGKVTLGPST